jgi:UDP-N-acetylglucosamine acyltransferase
MSANIHATAIVHQNAVIGADVEIGPYCIIGENVKIGANTKLYSHVVIEGHTEIGQNNEFYQFCAIGLPPQDKTYKGEPTKTIIGDSNLFREGCTVHRATTKENYETKIGNNGYFMSGVHIAHDCIIGDFVTLASGCACAGHVHLGDYVQMGGQCGVTPFVSVGKAGFIGGASAVDRDIPHFCTAFGNRIRLKGVNIIGLRRRGYSKEVISEVVEFYRMMESSALSPRAFVSHEENMSEYKDNEIVKELASFITNSEIGLPSFMS